MRVQLDEPGRVVRRLGRPPRTPARPCPSRRTRRPARRRPRRASRPSRPRPPGRRAWRRPAPSPPAATARIGPSTASGRSTGASDPDRCRRPRTPRAPIRACAGRAGRSKRRSRDRRRASPRPPGDPRAGQQERPRPRRATSASCAASQAIFDATWPGSRLQPVSARSASGSMRSAAASHSAPARRSDHTSAGCSGLPSPSAATRPSSWEPKESATISRPAVAARIRDSVATSAAVHSPGSCSAHPGCG